MDAGNRPSSGDLQAPPRAHFDLMTPSIDLHEFIRQRRSIRRFAPSRDRAGQGGAHPGNGDICSLRSQSAAVAFCCDCSIRTKIASRGGDGSRIRARPGFRWDPSERTQRRVGALTPQNNVGSRVHCIVHGHDRHGPLSGCETSNSGTNHGHPVRRKCRCHAALGSTRRGPGRRVDLRSAIRSTRQWPTRSELPIGWEPQALLLIGEPAATPPARPRRELTEVVVFK